MSPLPRIEALEARIAPAVFFLSGVDKSVVDSTGASVNKATAQGLAGSDIAVLLHAGDSLILDTDGDHIFDAGETRLMAVTGGTGLVFATDTGSGGSAVTDIGADDFGFSVLVQDDGKIIVGGSTGHDFALARYNPNGSLDTTFNGTGKVTTDFSGFADGITAMALDASTGKIIVAGYASGGGDRDFAVARYNSNGTPDLTFNGTGKTTANLGPADDVANGISLQSDGKIVLAGYSFISGNKDFALARFNADGTLDTTSFNLRAKTVASAATDTTTQTITVANTSGLALGSFVTGSGVPVGATITSILDATRFTISATPTATASGLTLQIFKTPTDTENVLTGGATNNTVSTITVADTTGLTAGMFITGTGIPAGTTITQVQGANTILISNPATATNSGLTFQAFSATGATGSVTTAFGVADDIASGVAVQADGKIVLAGQALINNTVDFALARYNADGTPDTTFDTDGKTTTAIGTGADIANSLAIQSDGKIVLAGSSFNGTDDDFALVRYTATGALDTTFNGTGKVTAGLSGADIAYDIAIQADGKIVVGGQTTEGTNVDPFQNNTDFAMMRFSASGALDPSFNGTGKVRTPISSGTTNVDAGRALAVQADGRIVLAGSAATTSGAGDFAVARYLANGALDTTFNGTLSTNGHFDVNEISGVAISDGFAAKIASDVNGSIATVLNDDETLAIASNVGTLHRAASIVSLEIGGKVTGNIFATGSISKLKIGGAIGGNIATGGAITASPGDAHLLPVANSFSNGVKTFTLASFAPLSGEAGGDITDVQLDHGAKNLIAGDGGPGAAGGSISGVTATVETASPMWVFAGNGGVANATNGGRGGSISNLSIKQIVNTTDSLRIEAGDGGRGGGPGRGGNGGAITGANVAVAGSITGSFLITAGNGGDGDGTGVAGSGGSISSFNVSVTGAISGSLAFTAGFGGDTAGLGLGAAGGSIGSGTIKTGGSVDAISLTAGAGGNTLGSLAGGAGGSITGLNLHTLGAASVVKNLTIVGGTGGDSTRGNGGAGGGLLDSTLIVESIVGTGVAGTLDIGGGLGGDGKTRGGRGGSLSGDSIFLRGNINLAQPALFHAGAGGGLNAGSTKTSKPGTGGAIAEFTLGHFGDVPKGITLLSGNGGSAVAAAAGTGGVGGPLSASIIGSGGTNLDLIVRAGTGGAGPTGTGNGGEGGRISSTTIDEAGALKSLTVQAGAGGVGGSSKGAGGKGGAIETLRVSVVDVTGAVQIQTGDGGDSIGTTGGAGGNMIGFDFLSTGNLPAGLQVRAGAGGDVTGSGTAGAGGYISRSSFTTTGTTSSLTIGGGAGGKAGSDGRGGLGGNIGRVGVNNYGTLTDGTVVGGAGGEGGSNSGGGGAGGSVVSLTLNVLDSKFTVSGAAGGAATRASKAGAGGGINGVSGSADLISFIAGVGGANTGGVGGNGGSVTGLDLDVVSTFVRAIIAGNGGAGSTKGGSGGSVTNVQVAGDIGDFEHNFDVAGANGMGGIAVGQAGLAGGKVNVLLNGVISNVTADRIATMIAGTPANNAITKDNAVRKISKITADMAAADVNGDGAVAHVLAGNYVVGTADTLFDGIVLVRSSGLEKIKGVELPGVASQFNIVKV